MLLSEMKEPRVAHDIGNILVVFCFAFLGVCGDRPSGLTNASQKSVKTAKSRKNLKAIFWKDIGKRISPF